jgi:beta-1,4-mannosyl-glycoprotein beta-1,4-N-acetylglucosaminyltransferase
MAARVWDTFIFGTEADLDMLECRLTELDGVAYRFVVSEARLDHQGHPKPMYLRENWERFSPWHDRLIHVEADLSAVPASPGRVTYWPFETTQRDAIAEGLILQPGDLVVHGDVDEIPRANILAAIAGSEDQAWCLAAQHHAYALEWLCDDGWRSLVTLPASQVPLSIQAMRTKMATLPVLDDASWHLSWFGGLEAQARKFSTTLHADIPDEVRDAAARGRLIRDGWHWQGHWRKLKPYKGSDWPKWVLAGQEPASWHKDGVSPTIAGISATG